MGLAHPNFPPDSTPSKVTGHCCLSSHTRCFHAHSQPVIEIAPVPYRPLRG